MSKNKFAPRRMTPAHTPVLKVYRLPHGYQLVKRKSAKGKKKT